MIDEVKLAELKTVFEKLVSTRSIAMSPGTGIFWSKYPGDKPDYFRDVLDVFSTLEFLWNENAELKSEVKAGAVMLAKATDKINDLEAVARAAEQFARDMESRDGSFNGNLTEALAALKVRGEDSSGL